MSFLDALGTLGVASEGFDRADARYRQRDREAQQARLTGIAIDEAIRKDELARGARAAMGRIGNRAAVKGMDITTVTPPDESDRWGETKIETTPGFDAAAGADLRGKTKAAADFYADQGELEQAQKYHAALQKMQTEGFQKIVVGIADGKPVQEIAAEFNQIGERRIVGGTSDGRTYRIKYEDGTESAYDRDQMRELAARHKWLEPEKLHNAAAGTTVFKGTTPIHTTPREPTPLDPDVKAAQLGLIGAQTDAARSLAGQRDRPKPGPAEKPINWGPRENQVRAAAKQQFTTTDRLGKAVVDNDGAVTASSLAMQMWREDPEGFGSAAEAVQAASAHLAGVRADALDKATREVEQFEAGGSSIKSAYGQSREERIKDRAKEIVRQTLKSERKSAPATGPARSAAPSAGARSGYTTDEGTVLPEGTKIRLKSTGKTMVVRGGELVEE